MEYVCVSPRDKKRKVLLPNILVGCMFYTKSLGDNNKNFNGEFDYHLAVDKCKNRAKFGKWQVSAPLCQWPNLDKMFQGDKINSEEVDKFITSRKEFYDKEIPLNQERLSQGKTTVDVRLYDEYTFINSEFTIDEFCDFYGVRHG